MMAAGSSLSKVLASLHLVWAFPTCTLTVCWHSAGQGGEVRLRLQGSCLPVAGRAMLTLLPELVGMLRTAAAEMQEHAWGVQATSQAALRSAPVSQDINGACLDGGICLTPILAHDIQQQGSSLHIAGRP